jgi:hypothetical protein
MRLEPLYRVRFTYPESWSVGLDGGWQQMFFMAEGRCEGSVTGRSRHPRKAGRNAPLWVMRWHLPSRKAGRAMTPGTVTRPARWRLAVIAGALALLTAGCGSSTSPASGSSPSPSPPSPSAPAAGGSSAHGLCDEAAALFDSLDQLTHIKVQTGMKNEITADLTNVKAKLTAFVDAAHGRWQAQTAGLKSALKKLQTEVKNLTSSPSVSALASVATAIGGVGTATQDLLAAVSTDCPSASPTPSG